MMSEPSTPAIDETDLPPTQPLDVVAVIRALDDAGRSGADRR
jgi:hypothetical protein